MEYREIRLKKRPSTPRSLHGKVFHTVVECGVKSNVMDYRSNAEHIGTDHKAEYDSYRSVKNGFTGKAETET